MYMTVEEIVRHYRQAKNKTLDIQILADLNAVEDDEIVDVLVEAGLVKNRKRMKKTPRQKEIEARGKRVRQMIRLGYTYDEIREEIGCGSNTVYKHVREMQEMRQKDEDAIQKIIMEAVRCIDSVPADAPAKVKAAAFDKCKKTLKRAEE